MLGSIDSIRKKPTTYKLLKIQMKPEMSIDEFQNRIDELFFTFDKDDSLLLDEKEFKEF